MTALMDVTREQVTTLEELVDLAASIDRSISSMQAARDGVLALASRWALNAADEVEESDITLRTVAGELGSALRVSDRTVQRRMLAAEALVERFPRVWAAQGAGLISASHARVIVDAGEHIDDPDARDAYSERVLEFAADESPNRVRPIAERIAEQYQSRTIEERHEQARDKRGMWVKDRPDAIAEMTLFGPAALIHGAYNRLTSMAKTHAKTVKTTSAAPCQAGQVAGSAFGPAATREGADAVAKDSRTLAQRRFDLAMDVLLTGAPTGHDTEDGLLGAITARVSITIPFLTLMGLDNTALTGITMPGTTGTTGTTGTAGATSAGASDASTTLGRGASGAGTTPGAAGAGVEGGVSAELDGHGPIDPHTARLLAGAASGWDRVLTHPVTGALLAVDRYRPSEYLKRHLRARDQRCRFPTCGMPAVDSDLDHTEDAALGGATEEDNLGALCRRHHVLKHHSPWHVEQLGGGLYAWTSPTGRLYIDKPPPQNTVTFTNTEDDRGDDADGDAGSGEGGPDPWDAPRELTDAPF